MTESNVFIGIADQFARGAFDGNLDAVFSIAASEGYVLLPDRKYTRAISGKKEDR